MFTAVFVMFVMGKSVGEVSWALPLTREDCITMIADPHMAAAATEYFDEYGVLDINDVQGKCVPVE